MAQHASALKQMRQGLKHRARNRMNLSTLKTHIKKLRTAIEGGDTGVARELLPSTVARIDKAAKVGLIHDNAAARYKSRLTHQVNGMAAAQA